MRGSLACAACDSVRRIAIGSDWWLNLYRWTVWSRLLRLSDEQSRV